MTERYPLRPDAVWYDAMRDRYGAALPDIRRLEFRRGMQIHVGSLYAHLYELDLLRHVDILGIVTRSAGLTIIDARYPASLYEDDRIALDFALEVQSERLNAACEHCGRPGQIVAKTGLEVSLDNPNTMLGDRFLCVECYEDWRRP